MGMNYPPMQPHSLYQSHGHSPHHQNFGQSQVPYSQGNFQDQIRRDYHNYQAMQQQHDISPHRVHPGTFDDIRGPPIHTPSRQLPHQNQAPYYLPRNHPAEPAFYYYSVSYDIPKSHALNQPAGFERFRHPISEWDRNLLHQQEVQGEFRGKPRRDPQGKEVKDDRENDRTKESLKESDRRSEGRKFEEDQNKDEKNKNRRKHDTSSDEEYERRCQRRINPRDFDTHYPQNLGPYMPYHPYPPGVHLPSPATHLGGPVPPQHYSPMMLTSPPPNTPLHAPYYTHPYHYHVPLASPFHSPFGYPDFLGPVFPHHDDSYSDYDRARKQSRRKEVRRTPSSSGSSSSRSRSPTPAKIEEDKPKNTDDQKKADGQKTE